ncbi:hypothetical protein [Litchfieldella rifensis]|uniref:Uncharacterized protein n=1 Tax=Litchfieldella rifensis TaxID=762643 RepID=A0ABV7LSH9_9GAMM
MAKLRHRDDMMSVSELSHYLAAGNTPIVEVLSLDGIYVVRLHHSHGMAQLVDEHGDVMRFTGTGRVSDLLGPMGIKHGILTWADQLGDEMIGIPSQSISPEEALAHGTRIAFR